MNDRDIVNMYWDRNQRAIAVTAEKYGGYCRSISYSILHSHEDAEECVNDTWFRAWRSMPPKRPKYLAAFLGKITRNLSINLFKRKNAEKRGLGQTELVLSELEECIPDGRTVDRAVEDRVITESVNSFLVGLPEEKRNIFIRRYWYVHPIKDIAAHYGMSESKVASLLFRMRNELKIHLEKDGVYL